VETDEHTSIGRVWSTSGSVLEGRDPATMGKPIIIKHGIDLATVWVEGEEKTG